MALSDAKLLHVLNKYIESNNLQPSISASAAPGAAPFATRKSGSIAVDECVQAYNQAYVATYEKNQSGYAAREAAAAAYRETMPALSGSHNIADFIACVGHGLVLGAIPANDAARLIYAAQVAHTANPNQSAPRRVGRPSRSESEDLPVNE
jgi:hypothetical protein